MAKITIKHDREACIGCGACAAVHDENWKMGDDNKPDPINTEVEEAQLEKEKEAAQACPVNAIHLEKDGEKII